MLTNLEFNYDEPLYRPPSEARSLILQLTIGCSWNRCAFCEMYQSKRFRIRPLDEIICEINHVSAHFHDIRRVFLADGDAFALPYDHLMTALETINKRFPNITRISSYAMPKNIKHKSNKELQNIYDAGLKLVYVGAESGDNEVLKRICKGEDFNSTVDGLLRFKAARIKSSVIIINGLAGSHLSHQHALASARLINKTQPEYLSTLVLSFPAGANRYKTCFGDDFEALTQRALFEELKLFIANTDLKNTVFRSDHASNYLALKGILGRDRGKLLEIIQSAIDEPTTSGLRNEWERSL